MHHCFRLVAHCLGLISCLGCLLSVDLATAQLPAFPGAEGAARDITGGRGGDVYRVTNLNDSGAGSLRDGIQTAPSTGRTIVFDVAGTIPLAASLDFNGKQNLTIAGQTAPGGGITLSGHRLRINDAENVVVQFLRVRPGEAADNADGVWVQNSDGVIVDHVTTSWAVDESISVTHGSDNVTVQWSTMTQGLLSHSYGSLLNSGTYTYAYNLYAHNRSRNPRLQQTDNTVMELDFVNNVIYNPGDRFAYGGSEYQVNWVENYGVRGPETGDTNHAFARDTDTESSFFVQGNLMDNNTNGLIDGVTPVLEGDDHDAAMFREGADYTLLGSRVDIPPVADTMPAARAYVNVLSRAGATNYRDAHDRDMVRDVINQQPGMIESESEWGPLPSFPAGSSAPDANGDGVPDTWASANYGDTTTPLNTAFAPSGYTYLEEYIHSLTPFAYAPVGVQQHAITTAYGQGADAQVNENGGTSATSSGDGAGTTLNALWGGPSGSTNQAIVLKFDLSEIEAGSVDQAVLELTTAAPISGTHDFKVWGLEHDGAGWDWDEASVEFATAPGLGFDGNSRTLGIDPRYTADGEPAEKDNFPLDTPGLFTLGEFSVSGAAAGETVTFDSLNLAVMLNLAAYFEDEAQAGLVTLVLEQTNGTGASAASFHSSEAGALLAPRLVVDAVLATAAPVLPGDANGDGQVDILDLDILSGNFGVMSGATLADGDFNSDGAVDILDLDILSANFGAMGSAAIPEPGAGVCLVLLLASGTMGRKKP